MEVFVRTLDGLASESTEQKTVMIEATDLKSPHDFEPEG